MNVYETRSEEETIELGRRIAATLPPRAVVLLIGNLGAGKTTLAKGIVAGLGVAPPEEVSSPTFTLIHEYGGGRVYHVDLYRLDRVEPELWESLEEHLYGDGVTAVEWAERLPHALRDGGTVLRFEPNEAGRRITLATPEERLAAAARLA